jgi:hypothetical protein
MQIDIYNPYANTDVTAQYVSVIESALNRIDIKTREVSKLTKVARGNSDGVVVVACHDVVRAQKEKYQHKILWIQGIAPEESYMRHSSKIRYWVLSSREKQYIKKADFIFFCSDAMKEHYERKYKLNFDHFYIMPCFNNEISEMSFKAEGKYNNNTFVYAGGLDPWQCFEPTVKMYKRIEDAVGNAYFRVLVKNHEQAKAILEKYNVKNYSIGFVPQNEIGKEMETAKFGFCLRDNSTVNNVATPTKLSTYIGHGVLPIYTKHILDFAEKAKNNEYCFCVDILSGNGVEKIIKACKENFDSKHIFDSYSKNFGEYYSKQYHVKRISEKLKEYFKEKN